MLLILSYAIIIPAKYPNVLRSLSSGIYKYSVVDPTKILGVNERPSGGERTDFHRHSVLGDGFTQFSALFLSCRL